MVLPYQSTPKEATTDMSKKEIYAKYSTNIG